MNKKFFIATLFLLVLIPPIVRGQKHVTFFELKGKADLFGDITIETLPVKKKQADSITAEVKKLNAIINEYGGKSIQVINGLSRIGIELFNTVQISNRERSSLYDTYIIYYFKKESED